MGAQGRVGDRGGGGVVGERVEGRCQWGAREASVCTACVVRPRHFLSLKEEAAPLFELKSGGKAPLTELKIGGKAPLFERRS